MSNVQTVTIDPIRSVTFNTIGESYVTVGGPLANPARLICFTNDTDGEMFFSTDAINDMIIVVPGGFKLFDLCTNRFHRDQQWVFAAGTQFYVRTNGEPMPTERAVYIEVLWGQ